MMELQRAGMQSQSTDRIRASAVLVVTDDRTMHVGQVHTQLVASARLRMELDERVGVALFEHSKLSDRQARRVALGGAEDSVRMTFVQVRLPDTLIGGESTFHNCQIVLLYLAPVRLKYLLSSL